MKLLSTRKRKLVVGLIVGFMLANGANAFGWTTGTTPTEAVTAGDITGATGQPTAPLCQFVDTTHAQINWTAATNAAVRGYEVDAKTTLGGTFASVSTVTGVNTTASGALTFGSYYGNVWSIKGAAGTNWRSTAGTYDAPIMSCDRISHTVAGPVPNGTIATGGFAGDGAAASTAQFNNIHGISYDYFTDTLYIADTGNNRVRAVVGLLQASPTIKTVAGTGTASFSGDSGAATSATLSGPTALAFDSATGDLYIADTGNNRIRKIHPSSGSIGTNTPANNTMTTVAGDGTAGASGGAGDGTAGAAVTSGELSGPQGIAWSTTNTLIISDTGHNRIRKLDTSALTLTAMYGATAGTSGYTGTSATGTAVRFNGPTQIQCSASPTCYFADTGNNKVKYCISSLQCSTLGYNSTNASGNSGDYGPYSQAVYNAPTVVFTDPNGGPIVADNGNNRIRYDEPSSSTYEYPVAGTGTAGSSGEGVYASTIAMSSIQGLFDVTSIGTGVSATHSGDLIIAEGNRIRVLERS